MSTSSTPNLTANPGDQGKASYRKPPVHSQFKPGVSGNPNGLRKGQVFISECYKKLLCFSAEELAVYKPKNVAEHLALAQVRRAAEEGGEAAIKEIVDRTEGKSTERKHHKKDITVRVTFDSEVSYIGSGSEVAELASGAVEGGSE